MGRAEDDDTADTMQVVDNAEAGSSVAAQRMHQAVARIVAVGHNAEEEVRNAEELPFEDRLCMDRTDHLCAHRQYHTRGESRPNTVSAVGKGQTDLRRHSRIAVRSDPTTP